MQKWQEKIKKLKIKIYDSNYHKEESVDSISNRSRGNHTSHKTNRQTKIQFLNLRICHRLVPKVLKTFSPGRGGGHLGVYYTSPQILIITISFSLVNNNNLGDFYWI